MSTLHKSPRVLEPISIQPVEAADAPVVERLWLLFRHDMSQFDGALPNSDGTYRSERLDRALDESDSTWRAWMLTADQHPLGFAILRALDEPTRVINSFFLVAPARRSGLGLQFARNLLIEQAHGSWSVAYRPENTAAAAFWPTLAAGFDAGWSRREAGVAGGSPDVWVTFEAGRHRVP